MGCAIGIAFFLTADRTPQIKFIWYDLWVGAYFDRAKRLLYILPLPCIVFVFAFKRRQPGDNQQ
jgi:hypothetical protein